MSETVPKPRTYLGMKLYAVRHLEWRIDNPTTGMTSVGLRSLEDAKKRARELEAKYAD